MNGLTRFLLICSGSNFSILDRAPTDVNKHVGLGATILFTGLLAALSGGYALYVIFENIWFANGFGLLWGLMIFNLDRYIVMSMKKKHGGRKQFWLAFPRIILAGLIALVIAVPLELRVFKKEIDKELVAIQNAELRQTKLAVDSIYSAEEEELLTAINLHKYEIKQKEDVYAQRQLEFDYERLGKESDRTSGNAGYGPLAKEKAKQMAVADADKKATVNKLQPKIDSLERRMALLQTVKDAKFTIDAASINKYNGIAAQLQAFNNLKKKEKIVGWAALFITLLIIALETAPIFVKLISPRGPYDDQVENHEHDHEVWYKEKVMLKEHRLKKVERELKEDLRQPMRRPIEKRDVG